MSHLIIELAPNSDDLQPSIQRGNEWKKNVVKLFKLLQDQFHP